MKTLKPTDVIALLNTRDDAVAKAIVTLSDRKAFGKYEANFGNSLADQIRKWQKMPKDKRYNSPLSSKQLDLGRALVKKYAGTLAQIANEKVQEQEVQQYDDARAELEYEQWLESRNELAYIQAGYRD